MSRETYPVQHQHHKMWLNYLAFYKDEMLVFQKRLEEVASRHQDQETRVQVEHFQNQLILQREQHDILRHDILEHETRIGVLYETDPILASNSKPRQEAELTDRVQTYVRLFHDMKDELYQFVARHV